MGLRVVGHAGHRPICPRRQYGLAAYDIFHPLARQVDDLFAMIELRTGQLQDPQEIAKRLQALGATLSNQADTLCAYLPRLDRALTPLQTRWGIKAITALCRIWQVEQDLRRKHLGLREKCVLNGIWNNSLDMAVSLLEAQVIS